MMIWRRNGDGEVEIVLYLNAARTDTKVRLLRSVETVDVEGKVLK